MHLRRPGVHELALMVLVVLATIGYLYLASTQWFVLDEFQYLAPEDGDNYLKWLVQPHNEHMVVLNKLWFSSLVGAVGLTHYALFAIPVVLGHVVAGCAVYVLTNRGTGDRLLAVAGAGVFLFMGAGIGTLSWAGQMQYTLAVACGLVQLALVTRPARVRWLPVLLVAGVGSISGSAYLAFGVIAAALLVRHRQFVVGACALGPPVAIVAFEKLYWDPPTPFAASGVTDVLVSGPAFILDIVETAVSDTFHVTGAGASVAVVLVLATVVTLSYPDAALRSPSSAGVVQALAGTCLLTLALIVVGRVNRVESSQSGGYSYLFLATIIPLAVILISQVLGSAPRGRLLVAGIAGVVMLSGCAFSRLSAMSLSAWKADGEALLMSAGNLSIRGEPVFEEALPAPSTAPTVTQGDVQGFIARGWLQPQPGTLEVQDQVTLATQLRIMSSEVGDCRAPLPRRIPSGALVAVHAYSESELAAGLPGSSINRTQGLAEGQSVTLESVSSRPITLAPLAGDMRGCGQ